MIDSGCRRGPPRARGEDPRREELRRRLGASGHARTRDFVAGLIGAGVDNGIGIAGLAPSPQLLVAKVVTKSRAIPVEAEAKAIRWAVDNGARVINMSLGGIRDPLDPTATRTRGSRPTPSRTRSRTAPSWSRRSETRPGAGEPVEVRELPGRPSARPRRQRDERHRRDPDVLEPRPDLQRHRGARAADPLDPARAPSPRGSPRARSRATRAVGPRSTERRRARRSPRRR